jgi:hypothetical protein
MHGKYKKAKVKIDNKWHNAARLVCELAHGAPPTAKHEAAHSCGNGHIGCVNPNHLRWATKTENEGDKLGHGTHNRGENHGIAKLTKEKVLDIRRRLSSGESERKLASSFGVSRGAIRSVRNGHSWAWLD